jgi:phospholipid/cholesterol/gamma-HCH transport system ATP-binding protein
VIALSGVTKRFGVPVLRDIDLTIPRGCLYGLIGPGASGKSVLLKTIAGLLRPDTGEVAIDGRDIAAMPDIEIAEVRTRFGMLFQNSALFDFMTVRDNIAFPLRRLFDLPAHEVSERVEERLLSVSLPGFGDRAVAGLSGGQKKRVGIARATVTRAPFVLYDEPTAGLDPVSTQRIFDLLRREQKQRETTVVMVSSDVERLLTVTDRVGMLLSGRLVFDGTTEEAMACTDPYVRQFVHGHLEGPL